MDNKKMKIVKELITFLGFICSCFLVGFYGLHFYKEANNKDIPYIEMDLTADFVNQDAKVIVLGADWCMACNATKKLLSKYKVDYVFIDVEKTNTPLAKHISNSYPVILMRNIKINGFRKKIIIANLPQGF